jgi:prevent-host-death family protein
MHSVSITTLRNHLQEYLSGVARGDEILVTSHGKGVARILPPVDLRQEAKKKLHALRQHCMVGDVVSPLEDTWDADK